MNEDKKKIIILSFVIALVLVLIGFIGYLFYKELVGTEETKKISTTTRRRNTTSEKKEESEEFIDLVPTTEPITTIASGREENISSSTTESSTKNSTTRKTTVAQGGTKTPVSENTQNVTRTYTVTRTVIVTKPIKQHEIATTSTNYPNALDSWEWEIANLINQERRKNGLNELQVAVDLRQLAEEAADIWQDGGNDAIKNYLSGNANYRKWSNLTNVTPSSLYQSTINSVDLTTLETIHYLGIAVLEKKNGMGGLKTYYYVIIYE